jgi:hypothetical protein
MTIEASFSPPLEQEQSGSTSNAQVPRVVSAPQDLDDHPDLVVVPSPYRTMPASFPASEGEADSVHSSLSDDRLDLQQQQQQPSHWRHVPPPPADLHGEHNRPALPRWPFPHATNSNGNLARVAMQRMDSASSSTGGGSRSSYRSFRAAAADWGWFDDGGGHGSGHGGAPAQPPHEFALPGQLLSWSLPVPTTHTAGRSDTPALRHWWLAQQQQQQEKKNVEPRRREETGT